MPNTKSFPFLKCCVVYSLCWWLPRIRYLLLNLSWCTLIRQTCPDKLHVTNLRFFQREKIRFWFSILSKCFFFGNIIGCCTSNLKSLGSHCCDGYKGTIKLHHHVWSKYILFNTFGINWKEKKVVVVSPKIFRRHLTSKLVGLHNNKHIFPSVHIFVMPLSRYLAKICFKKILGSGIHFVSWEKFLDNLSTIILCFQWIWYAQSFIIRANALSHLCFAMWNRLSDLQPPCLFT